MSELGSGMNLAARQLGLEWRGIYGVKYRACTSAQCDDDALRGGDGGAGQPGRGWPCIDETKAYTHTHRHGAVDA